MASVQPSFAQKELHRFTDTTKTASDMFSLLDHVNVSDLRAFLHQQIDKMASSTACSAYYSMSINQVLPTDIVRDILSFDNSNYHRNVCKQWNQLNNQNEEHRLKAINKSIITRFPEPEPSVTSKTKKKKKKKQRTIWILHSKRGKLHSVEKRLKYRFLQKLEDVKDSEWEGCKSGDIVLVHDGSYKRANLRSLSKDITFIGVHISPSRPIFCRRDSPTFRGSVILENLTLGKVSVEGKKGKLVMKNCSVRGVKVENGASLEMRECKVAQRGFQGNWSAIDVSPFAEKVVIANSRFINFKRCVDIVTAYDNYGGWNGGEKPKAVHLTITDNVLEKVNGLFPFSEYYGSNPDHALFWEEHTEDVAVIRGNSVFPEDAKVDYDPNELYVIDNLQRMQDRDDFD